MIEVPANETDQVRIFAVNGDSQGSGIAQSFLSRLENSADQIAEEAARLKTMLGATRLDPTYTETIKVKDVRDMGLSQYIASAMDIPADRLSSDRARLDALEGEVLIVLSRALGPEAQVLHPGPELTFIGAYQMAEAPMSGSVVAPHSDPGPNRSSAASEVIPAPRRRVRPGGMVLLGLGLAAILVLALVGGN